MGSPKPREERKTVFVRARLRTDQGWSDVTIGNVSSRGLMLQSTAALRRNEFIEVRYHHVTIVGRIVWSGGTRCGVRTQDCIDLAALLARAPAKPRKADQERRSAPRSVPVRPAAVAIAEKSRRRARVFDWAVVAIGGSAAAMFAARLAYSALDLPLAQIGGGLAGKG